jgi:hypothetical protein
MQELLPQVSYTGFRVLGQGSDLPIAVWRWHESVGDGLYVDGEVLHFCEIWELCCQSPEVSGLEVRGSWGDHLDLGGDESLLASRHLFPNLHLLTLLWIEYKSAPDLHFSQVFKKFQKPISILFHQYFYTHKKFHAQLGQNVHTQTPKHSTGLGI